MRFRGLRTSQPQKDGGDKFHHSCSVCGWTTINRDENPLCENCGETGRDEGAPATCLHLGPQIDAQACPTCRGHTTIKVFACDIFGRSQLAGYLPGVQACEGCDRFEPAAGV